MKDREYQLEELRKVEADIQAQESLLGKGILPDDQIESILETLREKHQIILVRLDSPDPPAQISTGGGAVVSRSVDTKGGDFIGRDQFTKLDIDEFKIGDNANMTFIQGSIKKTVTPHQQVSPPPKDYVVRVQIENKLRELLTDDSIENKLVNLYGWPGVGKSLTGRKVAFDIRNHFADGVLLANLDQMSPKDILSDFLRVFVPDADTLTIRPSLLLEALQDELTDKKVLIVLDQVKVFREVVNLILKRCPSVSVLLISNTRLVEPDQHTFAVNIAEMNSDEALELFLTILGESYLWREPEPLQMLATQINNIPAEITWLAQELLRRQIPPSDKLEELTKQKGSFAYPGLETVYENLPKQAKEVLPILGILGNASWSLHAVVAISQIEPSQVTIGLRQLFSSELITREEGNQFRVSPMVREFALYKLEEFGSEMFLQMLKALTTHYYLDLHQQKLNLKRQELFQEYVTEKGSNEDIANQIQSPDFIRDTSLINQRMQELGIGYFSSDPLKQYFEENVLKDETFAVSWFDFLNSHEIANIRQQLSYCLSHVAAQKNWEVLRRFSQINSQYYIENLNSIGNEEEKVSISIDTDFFFIRKMVTEHVNFVTNIKACTFTDLIINYGEFIQADWLAVQIVSGILNNVDLVGLKALGTVFINCEFNQVDLRNADLRGSIFYGCNFNNVNFRNANLDHVEFYRSKFQMVDARGTRYSSSIDLSDDTLIVTGRIIPGSFDFHFGEY